MKQQLHGMNRGITEWVALMFCQAQREYKFQSNDIAIQK